LAASDDHADIRDIGTVYGASESNLRYMRRRRVGTADRNGDPLDGIVNLWDVAIVLAVGFLVAALTAAGITGLLTSENMTIVTNPGAEDMQVVVKDGDQIKKLDLQNGAQVQGVGTLLGSFYTLADGTVVYVPAGTTPPTGTTPGAETTTTPGGVTPTPTTTDYPTTDPYQSGIPTPATTAPGSTGTSTPGAFTTPQPSAPAQTP
jgi:hypothetical protein